MKKVLSILLIGLFAVALVFAQEKATKPQKAKSEKMECCKDSCSEECSKMKSDMKEKQKDCPKANKAQKEAEPKKESK